MKTSTAASIVVLCVNAGLLAGCASLDARAVAETHRLDEAPYYVNVVQPVVPPGVCALVLPAVIDPQLREVVGYGDRLDKLRPVLDAVNARLAQGTGCISGTPEAPQIAGAPRVYVGTSDSEFAPAEAAYQQLPTDRFAPMVLHLQRPTEAWRLQSSTLGRDAGKTHVIAIQLGVSQYPKGRSGLFRKSVQLGTGHREPIRFMTAEDKPVEVLHLTGVLLDSLGRPVRAGAEGVILRDTPFSAQVFDVVRVLDDLALERVLNDERRTDLPGAPLKLDVALDNLLAQLTRGEPRVPAQGP